MKNINLSNIIGDNCANLFALAFRSMNCTEFIPRVGEVKKLISVYLKEYEHEISSYFDESVLDDYCFVTDTLLRKRKIIDEEISKIDMRSEEIDDDKIQQLFEEKRFLQYTQLFNSGIYNLGISSYIIESNQIKQRFDWNKHYNAAPDMQYIIKNQRKYQCCKAYLVQKNPGLLSMGDCFLSDILLIIDLYRVKQQCTLEKFMSKKLTIIRGLILKKQAKMLQQE